MLPLFKTKASVKIIRGACDPLRPPPPLVSATAAFMATSQHDPIQISRQEALKFVGLLGK